MIDGGMREDKKKRERMNRYCREKRTKTNRRDKD